jgi:hypothetical protein
VTAVPKLIPSAPGPGTLLRRRGTLYMAWRILSGEADGEAGSADVLEQRRGRDVERPREPHKRVQPRVALTTLEA